MVRAMIGGSGLIGMLAWVSSAAAASNVSTEDAYNGQANVQHQVAGAVAGQSTLPFTGQSLALIVGVALLLVVAGLMLRRAARRSH
jgi:hypothetical protein